MLLIAADPDKEGNVTYSHNFSISVSGKALIVSLAVNFGALQGHSLILHSDRGGVRNTLLLGETPTCLSIKQRKDLIEDAPGEALDPFASLPECTAPKNAFCRFLKGIL